MEFHKASLKQYLCQAVRGLTFLWCSLPRSYTMKKIIALLLLVIAGFFAYQYFLRSPHPNSTAEDEITFNNDLPSDEGIVNVPEKCQEGEKNLEDAIYGSDAGNVSFAQRNTAERRFPSCLKDAGFSDKQINDAVGEVQNRVKGYIKQDSGGQ
jgi:hypothetical protein